VNPVEPLPRSRRRRTTVLLGGVLLLLIAAATAAAVWWWGLPIREDSSLEADWAADVVVLAGDGVAGTRDDYAFRARFSDPFGIALAADGTVYIADGVDAHRIRRLTPDGLVSTVAGGSRGFADGSGATARFDTPSGMAIAPDGSLYVADTGNNRIRRVTPDGHVTTVAGDGTAGYRDGPAAQARFNGPVDVAVDGTGRVIVADTYNHCVRAIEPEGSVTTIAGCVTAGWMDGAAMEARFDTPSGVALDASGVIYVADTGNDVVRRIDNAHGVATHGWPGSVPLVRPLGIAIADDGAVYVTDDRGRLVEMAPDGAMRVIAGSRPGFADGAGEHARFRRPAAVAASAPGRLVVADTGNALIRLVTAHARREMPLPRSPRIAPRFDATAFGWRPLLWPVEPMDGPHEVAGTLGEARGGEGAERLHTGVDVRAEQGTPVLAVRSGTVSSPIATGDFGSLNEWMRVGALTYVHVRAGRTRRGDIVDPARFVPSYDESGRLVRVRVKRGATFITGDVLGSVNAFNHVHLNVGWPGEEYNPLQFRLVQFDDGVPPTIAAGGVRLYDEHGTPLTRRVRGRLVLTGKVRIVVDAWDQADGSRPGRRLGLYELGYQVLHADGTPAPGFDQTRQTMRFDRHATDPEAARLVYAQGSGIPFYGRRATRFLYVITNTFREGIAASGFWDTADLAPGDYTLRVRAADFHGNEAISHRDVPLTIASSEAPTSTP
jgi:sugar lactone lactonase YvrE